MVSQYVFLSFPSFSYKTAQLICLAFYGLTTSSFMIYDEKLLHVSHNKKKHKWFQAIYDNDKENLTSKLACSNTRFGLTVVLLKGHATIYFKVDYFNFL